jgi:hypothetical protein
VESCRSIRVRRTILCGSPRGWIAPLPTFAARVR